MFKINLQNPILTDRYNMKKNIFIILLGLSILSLISGCGEQTTAPTMENIVSIIAPKDGSVIGDSVTVAISIDGLQGVERVDIYIDGDSIFSDSTPPYQFFWSTHNVQPNAEHYLQAVAFLPDTTYASDTTTVMVQLQSGIHQLSEYQVNGKAVALAIDGNSHYLFSADSDDGVAVFDISNPYSPVFVSNIDISGSAVAVDCWGGYLFIAEGRNGVTAVDVSNPYSPIFLDSYDTPGEALNLSFDATDSVLYVADDNTLQIIELDDNFNLIPFSQLDMQLSIYDVTIDSDYAHLGVTEGVRIVDISDPANPSFVQGGVYYTQTPVIRISSFQLRDYLSLGADGIAVLSTADVSAPTFRADFSTSGYAGAVAYRQGGASDILFVADGSEGILALRYVEGDSSTLYSITEYDTQGSVNDIIYRDGLIYIADDIRIAIFRFVE